MYTDKLTLKEKIQLCSGRDEWFTKDFKDKGLPAVMMSDGPHGLRKQEDGGDMLGVSASKPATCYPTASIAACSFDKELMYSYGQALGDEAARENIAMVLGPGVCIKRNPLCGRNFEYFSEDPYLAGKLGAAYIKGMQSTGTAACIKHFACNSQEYFRMTSDSLLDERTLREIYLAAFEIAIKESSPAAIMGAYNKINGTYCCSDRRLLTDILREEWGFEGMVVTDWTAVYDRTDSFKAGCDLVMPGGNAYGEKEALAAIEAGSLREKDVEACAERVGRFVSNSLRKNKEGVLDSGVPANSAAANSEAQTNAAGPDGGQAKEKFLEKHHEMACRIARESAVLLKNEADILPLEDLENVVFLGQMAEDFRYQGFGSSKINPTRLDQIRTLAGDVPYAPGYKEDGGSDDVLINEAVALASEADRVVIFAGLPGIYESEGYDRENLSLPQGHNRLIEAVSGVNENVIVVLLGGSVMELPWIDRIKGLLYMGLSGQAGAKACLELLTGRANPSGRLAETWPVCYEDVVSSDYYIKGSRDAQYREGIYVGYRYYEKAGVGVRFPFGYGLSYTAFAYSDLKVDEKLRQIRVRVTNTGNWAGAQVTLLYVRHPFTDEYRPVRELKGFEKTWLDVGESREIVFTYDDRAFAYWDDGWRIDEGDYTLEICGDANMTQMSAKIHMEAAFYEPAVSEGKDGDTEESKSMEYQPGSWYTHPEGKPTLEDFKTIYKGEIPQSTLKPYTINSNIADMLEDSRLLRRVYGIYEKSLARQFGRGSAGYKGMMVMAKECPLRSVQNNLMLKKHFAQAIADLGNGHYLKMIGHLLK